MRSQINQLTPLNFTSSASQIFNNPQHETNILNNLQESFKKKEFCDIVLMAGADQVTIPAHRNVLSASSDYFKKLLPQSIKDAIELSAFDDKIIKSVVEFMYTGIIELTSENVANVLQAATYLEIKNLKDACSHFIGAQLNTSNCIVILLFAERYNLTELYEKALQFGVSCLSELIKNQDFLSLDKDYLVKFLSNADQSKESAESSFICVSTWVQFDQENRNKSTLELLKLVHFQFLTPKFIIDNRHGIFKEEDCQELLLNWIKYLVSPEYYPLPKEINSKISKVKNTAKGDRLAFVSGYNDYFKIQIYDSDANIWSFQNVPTPPTERIDYGIIFFDNKLIIAGGTIKKTITNTVECLDFQTKKWYQLPAMKIRRKNFGIEEINGELYVVGGISDKFVSSSSKSEFDLVSVEKFNFTSAKWCDVEPLLHAKTSISTVSVNGILYAATLYLNANRETSVQCFDSAKNQWTEMSFRKYLNTLSVSHVWLTAVNGNLHQTVKLYKNDRYNTFYYTNIYCCNDSTDYPLTKLGSEWQDKNRINVIGYKNSLILIQPDNDGLVKEFIPETNEWNILTPLLNFEKKQPYHLLKM